MQHQHHHLIANILHLLVGGGLGLIAASLTYSFGWRSADRLPGESRWPHCGYCFKRLSWREIFPVLGWLLRPESLSLSCPCGKRRKQWAQPAAELLGFAIGMFGMYLVGWGPALLPLTLGLGLLPAMAIIDLFFGIIPDGQNLLIAAFGLWWTLASGEDVYLALVVAAGLLGVGLFCALVYSKWRGREMLGLGDVKFFAAAGLWLEPQMVPWFLGMAGVIGVAIGMLWKRSGGGKEFPFAPALCLSLAGCVLYQIAMMQFE